MSGAKKEFVHPTSTNLTIINQTKISKNLTLNYTNVVYD